jgi:hypothetical protein
MIRSTVAGVLALLPALAVAQRAPQFEARPLAKALSELDFPLEIRSQNILFLGCGVALFDSDAAQPVCIDPVTGATRRAGRKGEGPGEFQSVRNMVEAPGGGLWVADWRNQRLTLVTTEWKAGRSVQLTKQPDRLFRATADSILTLGGPRGLDLVSVSLRDGHAAPRFSPMGVDSTGIFASPDPNQSAGFWLVPRRAGGWVVASAWKERLFVVDESGKKRGAFGRDMPVEMLSPRELAGYMALFVKMNPQASAEVRAHFSERFAKTPKPAIATTPVEDAQGRLWAATGRIRSDSTEVDVFAANGTFLGTRRMPGEVMGLAIRGDEIVALVKYIGGELDGSDGVVRYRIR